MPSLKDISRFITSPEMLMAYAEWRMGKAFSKTGPALSYADHIYVDGWLNFSEFWSHRKGISPGEKLFINRCFKTPENQKVAIDVGANIGIFSMFLAGVGYEQIHAFEPIAQNFDRLKNNVEKNHLQDIVILNRAAVGEQQGMADFSVAEDSLATSRLASSVGHYHTENASLHRVPVMALDPYCQQHKINRIHFLKIDVEGMEPYVLRGATDLLRNHCIAHILMEMCPINLNSVGLSVDELYETIVSFGYAPFTLLENGEAGHALNLDDLKKIDLANVLLIPVGR